MADERDVGRSYSGLTDLTLLASPVSALARMGCERKARHHVYQLRHSECGLKSFINQTHSETAFPELPAGYVAGKDRPFVVQSKN